jgi:hypothetical protein
MLQSARATSFSSQLLFYHIFQYPFPAKARGFLFSHIAVPAAGSAFNSMGTGRTSSEEERLGVKLTTHLHLAPRLRIGGSIASLPLWLFGVHRGNFTFTFFTCKWKSVEE